MTGNIKLVREERTHSSHLQDTFTDSPPNNKTSAGVTSGASTVDNEVNVTDNATSPFAI